MTVCLLIVESVSGSEQNCSWSLMVQVCNCQWTKAYRFVLLLYQRWKNKTLKSPPLRAVRMLHQQQRERSHLQLLKTAWTATAPKSLNHRRHRQTHLHKAMRQEAKVKVWIIYKVDNMLMTWLSLCLCNTRTIKNMFRIKQIVLSACHCCCFILKEYADL